MSKYSVVIITLNEITTIPICVDSIRRAAKDFDVEIIISDGGSLDGTLEYARAENIKTLNSKPGRGTQFGLGFSESSGNICLFLHADSQLPPDAFDLINKAFGQGCHVGTFKLSFSSRNFLLRLYAYFTRFESIFTTFGDQCIVVRRDAFLKLGGFEDWPIMEDVHFLRRARRTYSVYKFDASVLTSPRRFLRSGIVKQQLRNLWYILLYLLGRNPEGIAERYEKAAKIRDRRIPEAKAR